MLFQLDIMSLESSIEILWSVFVLEELNSTSVFKSYSPMKFCRGDAHWMTEARLKWQTIHRDGFAWFYPPQTYVSHIQHQYLAWHHLVLDSLCAKLP